MFSSKILQYWYSFLTLLILIVPIKINILDFIPGLLLTWVFFFVFWLGSIKKHFLIGDSLPNYRKNKNKVFPFLLAICFVLYVPQYVSFYTGNTIYDIFQSTDAAISNYNKYQAHFEQNNLGQFSVDKIPHIILFSLFKFFASLAIIYLIVFSKKKIYHYSLLLLIICSFLYVSIGRGTSFELFELITLIVFALLLKIQLTNSKIVFSTSTKLQMALLAVIGIIYFTNNIAKRYGIDLLIDNDFNFVNCSTAQFCINRDTFLFKYFPMLSVLVFQISAYFAFGIFAISKLINSFLFTNISGFIAFMFPFGSNLLEESSFNKIICSKLIDCGVSWIPDMVMILNSLGFLLSLSFIYFLGYLATHLFTKISSGNIVAGLVLFYIVFFLISLPSGNFVTISSSNQLCLLFGIIVCSITRLNEWVVNLFH